MRFLSWLRHLPYFKVGSVIFFGSVLLVGIFFYYTHMVLVELKADAARTSRTFARLYPLVTFSEPVGKVIFDEVITGSNFPRIITSPTGEIQSWKGTGIQPGDTSFSARVELFGELQEMKQGREAIPITDGQTGQILAYLYYGDVPRVMHLTIIPYLELVVFSFFLIVIFWAMRSQRRSEQRVLWMGLAKETAHQLGTPITSMMGWVQLLEAQAEDPGYKEAEKEFPPDLRLYNIANAMQGDIANLSKIAQRFSKIGSIPELEAVSVNDLIRAIVYYFRRRVPIMEGEIVFREHYLNLPMIKANPELISWAFENVIRNAVDSLSRSGGGAIEILTKLDKGGRAIHVLISDNGKGIPKQNWEKVFQAGYTTRSRGWGLGLALTRRIVQEYHAGRIEVIESRPGERTTFRFELPGIIREEPHANDRKG